MIQSMLIHSSNPNFTPIIDGGEGNDTIVTYVYGTHGSVYGGEGSDLISLRASNHPIGFEVFDGGSGDDTININYLGNQSDPKTFNVLGGAGNDFISLSGTAAGKSTVIGGTGNDTIYGRAITELYKYAEGDGNDIIYNFGTTDTLQIGNGTDNDTYFKSTVGSDIFVSVGSGVITLKGAASLSTLNILGKEVDTTPAGVTISNYANSTLITSGGGSDYIYNGGNSVTIEQGYYR